MRRPGVQSATRSDGPTAEGAQIMRGGGGDVRGGRSVMRFDDQGSSAMRSDRGRRWLKCPGCASYLPQATAANTAPSTIGSLRRSVCCRLLIQLTAIRACPPALVPLWRNGLSGRGSPHAAQSDQSEPAIQTHTCVRPEV
eukprot:1186772-Prorocentrum_minimum.AAC.4